jgi:hypothetical protein
MYLLTYPSVPLAVTLLKVDVTVQKPNSQTYNFIEVSGHNLESSQT